MAIISAGWVYPIVCHRGWADDGWLRTMPPCITMGSVTNSTGESECQEWSVYKDFAGSGIVHVFGATCAYVGCYFIGPRKGRFHDDGKPTDMTGHSVPLAALGGFILLFGFLAFNGGSQVITFTSFHELDNSNVLLNTWH